MEITHILDRSEGTSLRRASVSIQLGEKNHAIFFECDQPLLNPCPEAWLACSLLPSMKYDYNIELDEEVSATLHDNIPAITALYLSWYPELHPISIHGLRPQEKTNPGAQRVATFFSGGVDSFYTLLKHQNEITDLVFVHGIDMGLDKISLYNKTSEALHKIAAELGKNVITIRSNVRYHLLDQHIDWGKMGCGAAMFTIAHLLSGTLRRIYIPSTYTLVEAEHNPHGSHPYLDPLWSSESLEIVHDGAEASRVEKVAAIADTEIVQRNLRVCFKNTNGAYNCCRCEKCVRTMLELHLAGNLEQCTTFDVPLTPKLIRSVWLKSATVSLWKAIHEKLLLRSEDAALAAAVAVVLKRPIELSYYQRRMRKLSRSIRKLPTKMRRLFFRS